MFNKLKRFFGISTNVVEDMTEKVVEQETKQKRKYSFNYDNIDVNSSLRIISNEDFTFFV